MPRGTLFLVVGPSGVGKDTLIERAVAARLGLVVPHRVVTRPAEAGGEEHESVSEAEFDARERAGGFLLCWRAHGLAYGIPASAGQALAGGQDVLVNVSRGVIDEARRRLQPLRVIAVEASRETLAARLAARGRESAEEIAARLDRRVPPPVGPDVTVVQNDGALERAVADFLAALQPVRA